MSSQPVSFPTSAARSHDRRSSRRLRPPTTITATLRPTDAEPAAAFPVEVHDLSDRGLGLRSHCGLRPGRRCELELTWNGVTHRLRAHIRRCAVSDLRGELGPGAGLVYASGLAAADETSTRVLEELQLEVVLSATADAASRPLRIAVHARRHTLVPTPGSAAEAR